MTLRSIDGQFASVRSCGQRTSHANHEVVLGYAVNAMPAGGSIGFL